MGQLAPAATVVSYTTQPTLGLPGYSTYTFTATSDAGAIVGFNFDESNGSGLGFRGDFYQADPFGLPAVFRPASAGSFTAAGLDIGSDSHFLVSSSDGLVINSGESSSYLGAAFNYLDASRAMPSLPVAQLVVRDDTELTYRGVFTVQTSAGRVLERVGFPDLPPLPPVEPDPLPVQPPIQAPPPTPPDVPGPINSPAPPEGPLEPPVDYPDPPAPELPSLPPQQPDLPPIVGEEAPPFTLPDIILLPEIDVPTLPPYPSQPGDDDGAPGFPDPSFPEPPAAPPGPAEQFPTTGGEVEVTGEPGESPGDQPAPEIEIQPGFYVGRPIYWEHVGGISQIFQRPAWVNLTLPVDAESMSLADLVLWKRTQYAQLQLEGGFSFPTLMVDGAVAFTTGALAYDGAPTAAGLVQSNSNSALRLGTLSYRTLGGSANSAGEVPLPEPSTAPLALAAAAAAMWTSLSEARYRDLAEAAPPVD